jgi:flagellar biosynthesis chaperone FliJ
VNNDWERLSQLREARRTAAVHAVARERHSVEESRAQAEAATRQLAEQQEARAALQRDTAAALAQGTCRIEQLAHAGAWSRTLSTRIAEAGRGVAQAESVVAKRMAELDARRSELRAAAQRFEQIKQMHGELHKSAQRERAVRMEQSVDELAVQTWQRRGS